MDHLRARSDQLASGPWRDHRRARSQWCRQVDLDESIERLSASRLRDFTLAEIEPMLERFPRLRPRLHTAAGLLSGGEQQMLAVARGLLARPDMLLLDEPSLGLAPAVADELFGQFAKLRDEGMTLLIVDQMADHVLAIADRGYVLGGGRVVTEGRAEELRDTKLDEAYLGADPAVVN